MLTRRRHFGLGLWGIYLAALAGYLLYMGSRQFLNTVMMTYSCWEMLTEMLSMNWDLYRMVVSCFLLSAVQIAAGIVGLTALIRTPSVRKLEFLSLMVLGVQVLLIMRDVSCEFVRAQTFLYFHRTVLVYLFSWCWMRYQVDSAAGGAEIGREWFPFIRAFGRMRMPAEKAEV